MKKTNYKISVIVAVYNAEDYLLNCCKAILGQTYRNIELILVNDGSQDDSLTLCNKIQEKDRRVIVVDKENGGCYSAWNNGLDVATGDFIGFVDNDDYIQPQMYETLLDLLIKQDADICACNRYRNIDNLNDYCNMNLTNDKIFTFSGYEAVVHLLSNTQYIKPAMWDKLYKRSLFKSLRFPNTFFEDAALTYKLLYKSKKVVYTEKQFYAYSIRDGSMITTPWSPKKSNSYIEITNEAITYFSKKKEYKLVQAALYWQIQFGIEAFERMLTNPEITQDDYNKVMTCVRISYKRLKLSSLDFGLKKYIKKKLEFFLFTTNPRLLCKLKKKELR